MSHTPGPWRWDSCGNLEDKDFRVVLSTYAVPAESDRRLIAAAPELLALLRRIDELFPTGRGPKLDELDELLKRLEGV